LPPAHIGDVKGAKVVAVADITDKIDEHGWSKRILLSIFVYIIYKVNEARKAHFIHDCHHFCPFY